jgi:hypothetical protein
LIGENVEIIRDKGTRPINPQYGHCGGMFDGRPQYRRSLRDDSPRRC